MPLDVTVGRGQHLVDRGQDADKHPPVHRQYPQSPVTDVPSAEAEQPSSTAAPNTEVVTLNLNPCTLLTSSVFLPLCGTQAKHWESQA